MQRLPLQAELASHPLAVHLVATDVDPLPRRATRLVLSDLSNPIARRIVEKMHRAATTEVRGVHPLGVVPVDRGELRRRAHAALLIVRVRLAEHTRCITRGAGGEQAVPRARVLVAPRPAPPRRLGLPKTTHNAHICEALS